MECPQPVNSWTGADLVLFLGCRAGSVTTERWRAPAQGTRVLHIDADPGVLGANYETEAPVLADLRLALDAMNDTLRERNNLPAFSGARRAGLAKQTKREAFTKLADDPCLTDSAGEGHQPTSHAAPGRLRSSSPIREHHAHISRRILKSADQAATFITNRAHGALGYSLGASIGAQIAKPNSVVVAAMGDGSFGFAAGELETLDRLGLPVKLVVFSNASFGWIKAGQKHGIGKRYFSVDFSRTDHAAIAAAYGIHSATVERPDDLEPALRTALAHDGPALVDVISQPLEEAAAPVSEWNRVAPTVGSRFAAGLNRGRTRLW